MTKSQFRAMEKLWNNDCRDNSNTAIDTLHKIIGVKMTTSLNNAGFISEVPTRHFDCRRFKMTKTGVQKLWDKAQATAALI